MARSRVVVIGGGASGLAGAISAARAGASVTVCERHSRPGRKILVSGNGRCNLTNDNLEASFYNHVARPLVKSVFSSFGGDSIKSFFRGMGLFMRSEDGRVFPVTNQSSSVLSVLEAEADRLSVRIETDFDVSAIGQSKGHAPFLVKGRSGIALECDSIILACGGRTYPSLGSDGSGYALAKAFGHEVVKPVPAAVPLVSKDPVCHALQGQKIQARISSISGGKVMAAADGDLLFTKYGLSGTAILDISDGISLALNRDGKPEATVEADMAPFVSQGDLESALRKNGSSGDAQDSIAIGILPNKFGPIINEVFRRAGTEGAAAYIKKRRFKIVGTRGWNEADFTAGGVDLCDVDPVTLESKLRRGLYFSGEILDVNGIRGGYNLAWAWASGFVAGRSAACAG